MSAFRIRAIRACDAPAIIALRDLAGAGFTSLAVDDAALTERVEASAAFYGADVTAPGRERYMLALEHIASRRVVGLAAVKASIGLSPPFFNFRILRIAQASHAADRRFDMDVLILVNEFTGCSEVGSLFVHPDFRAGGVGRALAQARYLLIGADPQRFSDTVVSELRGVVDEDGHSPFWEAIGRHFFKMSFEEADRLSARTDNQFILDLMPAYPIYVDLLAPAARDVIGRCHAQGEGAHRLLQWEGFRFSNVVDIFDGGPLMSAPRDTIRTLREAQRGPLKVADKLNAPRRALIASATVKDFVCVPGLAEPLPGAFAVSRETLAALGQDDGAPALVWMEPDAR